MLSNLYSCVTTKVIKILITSIILNTSPYPIGESSKSLKNH